MSFNSLIGCPLNGTWNIVVEQDNIAANGYVFEWEMAFNQNIHQVSQIGSVTIDGDDAVIIDDTTFVLVPPLKDTVIDYALHLNFYCGDTLDTVFSVHWVEPFIESVTDTLCQGDTARWHNLFFTTDTVLAIRDTTVYGCDSIVDLSYTFMPSYQRHDTVGFCVGEPFIYEGVDYGGPTSIVLPDQTVFGCDSIVIVHLMLVDSTFRLQLQISGDGREWSADTVLHDCMPMTVYLRDTTILEQWRWWDFGDGDTLRQDLTYYQDTSALTHVYDSAGSYSITLYAQSIHGCLDSLVYRPDAVRVYPVPTADFSWASPFIYLHDPEVQFVNLSQPYDSLTFKWFIPTGEDGIDSLSEAAPHYEWPVGTTDVTVDLVATWLFNIDDSLTFSCHDTLTKPVDIFNDFLQFPNLVTPNGDGVNERWEIVNLMDGGYYATAEVWIYDRGGALVFHSNNMRRTEDFWDPNATHTPDGTYYYRFSAQSPRGIVKRNGIIEVLR